MSILKSLRESLKDVLKEAGYNEDSIIITESSRKDLGDFQINDAMRLAKIYHKSPVDIANDVANILKENKNFKNVNVAGPGFINFSLSDKFIIESLNKITNIDENIDKEENKLIFMDYGGANIAKTLHVGHLRSANIGEGVKRLAKTLGYTVISDVHFGDIGRQSGMVISEIKERYPNLPYFDENYNGDYSEVDFTITEDDLGEIYPLASTKAKEDESKMAEVIEITKELEDGNKGYTALWNKIKEVSIKDIKKVYKEINTTFDLYEGEGDCYPYIPEVIDYLEKGNYLRESEDAKVIDVIEESDNSPMPPLVVIKNNGGTLYATRELATMYSRLKRFNPDELWYFADFRQSLYFEQVFRAAKKTNLIENNKVLGFYGFGTMNGEDGKPFKTRDGGVMSLKELISTLTSVTRARINENMVEEEKRDEVARKLAIAALKYADLIPYRETDYIFDPEKFTSLEGKTGPYLLYSTIRMKSLLSKVEDKEYKVIKLKGNEDRKVALELFNLSESLTKSLKVKSLNELADYIYRLTSFYNSFYNSNIILKEEDEDLKESYLALTKLVYNTNLKVLNILGLEIPEKM